jgi:hypothetical protein
MDFKWIVLWRSLRPTAIHIFKLQTSGKPPYENWEQLYPTLQQFPNIMLFNRGFFLACWTLPKIEVPKWELSGFGSVSVAQPNLLVSAYIYHVIYLVLFCTTITPLWAIWSPVFMKKSVNGASALRFLPSPSSMQTKLTKSMIQPSKPHLRVSPWLFLCKSFCVNPGCIKTRDQISNNVMTDSKPPAWMIIHGPCRGDGGFARVPTSRKIAFG